MPKNLFIGDSKTPTVQLMTQSDLIDLLAEQLKLSKRDARELLSRFSEEVIEKLGRGTGFTIPELGTFQTEVQDVRKMYNPHYDCDLLIPPKRIASFSPSKSLREKMKTIPPGS